MKWKFVGIGIAFFLLLSQEGESFRKQANTGSEIIPDVYALNNGPSLLEPEEKPVPSQASSTDTIQVTDITKSGENEFTLVINNSLVIKDFKKMGGQQGEWVTMPGYRTKKGEYKDLVYPVTREAKETIDEAILRGKKNPGSQYPIVVNEDKIKLYKSTYPGKVKAYGTLTINSSLVIDIKMLEGKHGLWVALPTKKGDDGRYYDIVYPVTSQAAKVIKDAKELIVKKYETMK